MDGAIAAVTIELRAGIDGPAVKLLRDAIPDVQFWLDKWSELAASALAAPTTVVLNVGPLETGCPVGPVVVDVAEGRVHDAESARAAALAAALDGLIQACQADPREPTVEVRHPPGPPSQREDLESFGEGEMAVFGYVGDDPELSHDLFEAMDQTLERALHGIADLQDSTVVRGFGQWVIGRSER